jgi:uncharacterized ubiquitin-like protein YukD
MVEACISRSTLVSNFTNNYGVEVEEECRCCYKFKHELDLALQELRSVKKIIQILQEERNSTPYLNTVSTGNEDLSDDQNFELMVTKLGQKKLTSNKSENKNITMVQLNQTTLTTENKYATLASLQTEQVTSQKTGNVSNTIRKKLRYFSTARKRKIIIIAIPKAWLMN